MATIHFILQGKGGVGKSMIASMLYQALEALESKVSAYDTDPVNHTLSGYKEFAVKRINLLKPDGNIDARMFDELLENIASAPLESHVIVDNGASSFIALGAYMQELDMIETLESLGHVVFFHTVITGGQATLDTVDGFVEIARCFPNSTILVWLNPFFGAIEVDGKGFKEFKCYKEHSEKIHSLMELPMGNKDLIGKDLEELFAKRQSFKLGISSSKHIAVRSRLGKYWKQILALVEAANIT